MGSCLSKYQKSLANRKISSVFTITMADNVSLALVAENELFTVCCACSRLEYDRRLAVCLSASMITDWTWRKRFLVCVSSCTAYLSTMVPVLGIWPTTWTIATSTAS